MNRSSSTSGDGLALDFAGLDALIQDSPYHRWLGVRLKSLAPHEIEIAMPWREEFVSEPKIRYTHGGILATLIDLAADYAIAAKLGRGVPTVDLRIDYHKAALPGDLVARASIIKLGSTLATAEARIFDAAGALLASGRGVYLTLSREARG
ncbi:MAG: PaaI family thioesterase [Alphaproteobacteria bacterium]